MFVELGLCSIPPDLKPPLPKFYCFLLIGKRDQTEAQAMFNSFLYYTQEKFGNHNSLNWDMSFPRTHSPAPQCVPPRRCSGRGTMLRKPGLLIVVGPEKPMAQCQGIGTQLFSSRHSSWATQVRKKSAKQSGQMWRACHSVGLGPPTSEGGTPSPPFLCCVLLQCQAWFVLEALQTHTHLVGARYAGWAYMGWPADGL